MTYFFLRQCRHSRLQGSDKERSKFKQQLEVVGSEKQAVEKARQNLLQEISDNQKQLDKLKSNVSELHRQLGDMEDEKVCTRWLVYNLFDICYFYYANLLTGTQQLMCNTFIVSQLKHRKSEFAVHESWNHFLEQHFEIHQLNAVALTI